MYDEIRQKKYLLLTSVNKSFYATPDEQSPIFVFLFEPC